MNDDFNNVLQEARVTLLLEEKSDVTARFIVDVLGSIIDGSDLEQAVMLKIRRIPPSARTKINVEEVMAHPLVKRAIEGMVANIVSRLSS